MERLFDLLKEYIENNKNIEEFILDFEESFLYAENKVYDENIELYNLLDNIRMACAYYEDDVELRKQCYSYIDLIQFNKIIKENYKELLKITIT